MFIFLFGGKMKIKIIELLKIIVISVVEGISEWLPISSSGHMLILEHFIKLNVSNDFKELFFIFIQLGAIMAVIVLFFKEINPFKKNRKLEIDKDKITLWIKIIIACIPGAIVTLLLDDYIEEYLHTPVIISLMLILYGVIFIIVESKNKKIRIEDINLLTYKDALKIGLFQVLSIIPGTSRSGATIIGSLLIGVNRKTASEFTFYLAIPVMLGMSLLKLIKFGFVFSSVEIIILSIGMLVAFLVSILVIKFLLNYINKKDFKIFGIYRIILGLFLCFLFLC